MSWPHILSFSRVVTGPLVSALILDKPGDAYLLAAILFALASVTDLIDGRLARYSSQVSPLGIFLDTTADKVLVSLVLVSMAVAGLAAAWIPLVIIGREFFISGLRSFAASSNLIISAHSWGKGKTAVTMAAVFCTLVAADGKTGGVLARTASHAAWQDLFTAASWLLWLAAALTIVSGARYLLDARPLFQSGPRRAEVASGEQPRAAAGGER